MGLVDTAKAVRAGLAERFTPHPVVFHHVPKCGGTSVGRAIRKRYLLSQETVLPEETYRAMEQFCGHSDHDRLILDVLDLREQMLLYHMFRDVRCIAAHVRFSSIAWQRFRDRYAFITILREPVERFVSNYNWSRNRPGAHAHIEEELDAYLETDRARRMGAFYVEFFCGMPKDADICGPDAIRSAIENLDRFDVVGFLDDLQDFQAALHRRLGARIRIGHENRSSVSSSRAVDRLSAEQRQRVTDLCAPDIAVWDAARARRGQSPT